MTKITSVTYDGGTPYELTVEVGKQYDHDEYPGGTVNALYAKGSGLYKGLIEAELLFENPKTGEPEEPIYVDAETLQERE
jgi:hypothetical protein